MRLGGRCGVGSRGGFAGLVVIAAAAACVAGTVGAEASGSAAGGQQGRAGRSVTRTLKFVYDGSAFVQVRQHVDNRPGHSGDAYDDTYTKQVKWSITWPVTIEPERVLVGTPTATVSGTSSADVHSAGHSSCDSPVALPVANGKPYVGTNLVVVDRTPQFLTVRLERFPAFWAASPSCLDGQTAPAQVPQPDGAPGQAWVKSWGAPEFKVALFNNYKITPASIGNRYGYPLPAGNIWKKVTFDWSARLTLEGFSKGTPAPTTPAKPPAKGPVACKTWLRRNISDPLGRDLQRFKDDLAKRGGDWQEFRNRWDEVRRSLGDPLNWSSDPKTGLPVFDPYRNTWRSPLHHLHHLHHLHRPVTRPTTTSPGSLCR